MPVFRYSLNQPFPAECQGGAVTLGNFDGVHLGHQALLAETVRHARAAGGPAVAVTFDPPPARLLRPGAFQALLTPLPYRCGLLHQHGADHVLLLETSHELLSLEARDFFDRILVAGLRAKSVVEGFNFAFGHNRAGTGELLDQWGRAANMDIALLGPQIDGGEPISSSRVRTDVLAGDVASAHRLLGRPYRLFGNVGVGKQRGRTLGFPTANLTAVDNLTPGSGVYAARVPLADREYLAAAHIGPRPTFGDTASVEIHLLDFNGDLYGQDLAVDFHDKVREPRTFASPDELKTQIANDLAAVRNLLAPLSPRYSGGRGVGGEGGS